ncbi:MAG TPA: NAD-dependent deacylase [Firmicutes bacterium]|jgi:NAD-dependent deacetylase|nr:NAD-dependent deacylase [Bacillota bacterium]
MEELSKQEKDLKIAARKIASAKKVVALTGAGISVASGIMPFRGKGGLWEKYDPAEVAEINRFLKHPAKSWIALREIQEVVEKAHPNPAHFSLARMEGMGFLFSIITQNVDGLHQEAGNKVVIEFHGNTRRLVCMECRALYPSTEIPLDTLPPYCPSCGGLLKPDAVFFGESIPTAALLQARVDVQQCEAVLVVGTSGMVEPAASLPSMAKSNGAFIIEINPEPTALTSSIADIFLKGRSEEILPKLVDELGILKEK